MRPRFSDEPVVQHNNPVSIVESFVDRQRFAGACYRAADWICLGQTRGRGRQGPAGRFSTTIKDVYVCTLGRLQAGKALAVQLSQRQNAQQ